MFHNVYLVHCSNFRELSMACVTAILPLALKRIGLYLVRFPFVCVFFFHFIQSKRLICYWNSWFGNQLFLFSTLRKNAAFLFVEKITPTPKKFFPGYKLTMNPKTSLSSWKYWFSIVEAHNNRPSISHYMLLIVSRCGSSIQQSLVRGTDL